MSNVMNQSAEKTSWIIAAPGSGMLPGGVSSLAAIRHNMVEEWLRSEAETLELRLASAVDASGLNKSGARSALP